MAQSLADVNLHIIFSTKHREALLPDEQLRQEMHAYLASIIKAYGSHPFIVGGTADHVHMLCSLPKVESYSKLIGEAKRNSSKWIKGKNSALSGFHWQNGYGAFSVSHSLLPKVQDYIRNQEEHHRIRTFQEEFREFLMKHHIEFDERYVWD